MGGVNSRIRHGAEPQSMVLMDGYEGRLTEEERRVYIDQRESELLTYHSLATYSSHIARGNICHQWLECRLSIATYAAMAGPFSLPSDLYRCASNGAESASSKRLNCRDPECIRDLRDSPRRQFDGRQSRRRAQRATRETIGENGLDRFQKTWTEHQNGTSFVAGYDRECKQTFDHRSFRVSVRARKCLLRTISPWYQQRSCLPLSF